MSAPLRSPTTLHTQHIDPVEGSHNHFMASCATDTRNSYHSYTMKHSVHDGIGYFTYGPPFCHTNKAYTPPSVSDRVSQCAQQDLALWKSTDAWMTLAASPTPTSSSTEVEMDASYSPSALHSPLYCDSRSRGNHLLDEPTGSQSLLLSSYATSHPGNLPLDEPAVSQSLFLSSQATSPYYEREPNDQSIATTHPFVSSPSLSSSSFSMCTLPASTGLVDSDPHLHLAPSLPPAFQFRRRRTAPAIEYNGMWIDADDLSKGLTEPGGRLSVHQCLWEKDHNPCYLWIVGKKPSVNAHIQKWHGGMPDGEEVKVGCRWPACNKVMRKDSIARHIVRAHLGEKWTCRGCGKVVTRGDIYWRHTVESDVEACSDAGALTTYATGLQVIDTRTALSSGGRLRYAGA